jgi:hypothetical protein
MLAICSSLQDTAQQGMSNVIVVHLLDVTMVVRIPIDLKPFPGLLFNTHLRLGNLQWAC